jgi:hypothetical protein
MGGNISSQSCERPSRHDDPWESVECDVYPVSALLCDAEQIQNIEDKINIILNIILL